MIRCAKDDEAFLKEKNFLLVEDEPRPPNSIRFNVRVPDGSNGLILGEAFGHFSGGGDHDIGSCGTREKPSCFEIKLRGLL